MERKEGKERLGNERDKQNKLWKAEFVLEWRWRRVNVMKEKKSNEKLIF